MTRRLFLIAAALYLVSLDRAEAKGRDGRPNVLLIITDDQGHGDLGFNGNPKIRTPRLDQLARESVRLDRFYVSPVCAPTRAALLTGRYNYRTGVVDTYLGRALMYPDEVTLAEMLGAGGYRTAIFGKWHLGDNYPMRPIDQGFQEALVLKGGGIGQPSDPPGGESYFDPILQKNGHPVKLSGYCSDLFTDAAIDFITENRDRPFFAYLAFNCPHAPLQVPDRDYLPYKAMNLAHDQFPQIGHPLPGPALPDVTARVYGMITNIDTNLGRLLSRLDALGLTEETIVVFLTDNGPQQVRYNSGMLDRKGNVHEGGIRVPCFLRWPEHWKPKTVDRIAAHIDLTPTVLEACGVAKLPCVAFDGESLVPLLEGRPGLKWPDRTLMMQWHRGDAPEKFRAFAARSQRYKLVRPESAHVKRLPVESSLELYDMESDPLEFRNLAADHPEIVAQLRARYENWFEDVGRQRGYAPSRIHLGAAQENPTILTRQDWRGPRAGANQRPLGHWEVEIARPGTYTITLRFAPVASASVARLTLREASLEKELPAKATQCTFRPVALTSGPGRLEATIGQGDAAFGPQFVEVERID
jgi:arylsulfatase A-like enzyme